MDAGGAAIFLSYQYWRISPVFVAAKSGFSEGQHIKSIISKKKMKNRF
jgi:hypothetical protein